MSDKVTNDDPLRSLTGVLGTGALVALFSCVPMIGAVRAELHVSPLDCAISMGLFWLVMIAGAVVYHTLGPSSRAYLARNCAPACRSPYQAKALRAG